MNNNNKIYNEYGDLITPEAIKNMQKFSKIIHKNHIEEIHEFDDEIEDIFLQYISYFKNKK